MLPAATKKYAEQLREAVATTFLTLEAQFVLTGQLSGEVLLGISKLITHSNSATVDLCSRLGHKWAGNTVQSSKYALHAPLPVREGHQQDLLFRVLT